MDTYGYVTMRNEDGTQFLRLDRTNVRHHTRLGRYVRYIWQGGSPIRSWVFTRKEATRLSMTQFVQLCADVYSEEAIKASRREDNPDNGFLGIYNLKFVAE